MSSLGALAQGGQLASQVFAFGGGRREVFGQLVRPAVGLTCQADDLVGVCDSGCFIGGGLLGGAAQQRHSGRAAFPSQRVVVAQQFGHGQGFLLGSAAQLAQSGTVRAAAGGEFFLRKAEVGEALVDKVDEAFGSIFGHGHGGDAITGVVVVRIRIAVADRCRSRFLGLCA